MDLEYGYAGHILKADKQADGSLMVYGMATDPSLDLDGQGCDPEWLKQAMPDWFKVGNVREQHGSTAAGVGKELTREDGDRWMLKAHIVDPVTAKKVEAGVLKGFSIGVRNGKVARDKAAGYPNGKIVGGKIVEISLVDRPCNPNATMTIVKAASGSDVLEPVVGELIDIDPSMYLGQDDAPTPDFAEVASDDDDSLFDEDEDSQAVDEPVDGDDGGDELSLFDDLDLNADLSKGLSLFGEIALDMGAPLAFSEADDLDDVAELIELTGEPVLITKGLLESLIHGPKKPKAKRDGDGDGKVGDGERERERERMARERRDREAERERKHRGRMDAERAQDAERASRQGRRMEAGEHRARLGHYDKALSVLEYRRGVRLVDDILAGRIEKSVDVADDAEIVAELAELMIAEAAALAAGAYETPEDLSLLVDTCAAIVKSVGAEPTILKSEGSVLDGSSAAATLDVAEIVKAQVAEQLSIVREAHEAETATLRAQVAKMAATPLPGGPVVNKTVMPSTPAHIPAQPTDTPDYWRTQALRPGLSNEVRAGYLAKAEQVARRG